MKPLRRAGTIALAFAAHAPALAAGFVWLDHGDLEGGAALAPPAGFLGLFTHGFARTGFYRPLTALSLSVDALLGRSPLPFHLDALVLFSLAGALAGAVARQYGASERATWVASALAVAHPLTGEVANALAFRSELLLAVGLLGVVWAVGSGRYLLAAAAVVLACLSKETGLVLAPAFALVRHWPRRSKTSERALIPLAVAWLAAFGLRVAFAPPWHSGYPELGAVAAVGTRLGGVGRSVLAVLPPFDLRVCDAIEVLQPWRPLALLGLVALAALAFGALRVRGLLLLCALAAIPSLGLVPAPRLWSLHYLYLPWLFGAGALAIALDRLKPFFPVATALVLVLTAFSLADSWRYRDDLALWSPEVAARPQCREGQLYLGDARRQRGDLETAAEAYQAAVVDVPGFVSFSDRAAAYENLGLTRLEQGRAPEAETAFEQALVLQPDELERRKLNHDLAAAAFARADFARVEQRLSHEVSRPDALPESIELLRRARAAAQISHQATP